MIVPNTKFQRAGFMIGVFASITTIFANIPTVVNVAYNTCDRFGWCKHQEPCAPILAPRQVCPDSDSQKNSDVDVN